MTVNHVASLLHGRYGIFYRPPIVLRRQWPHCSANAFKVGLVGPAFLSLGMICRWWEGVVTKGSKRGGKVTVLFPGNVKSNLPTKAQGISVDVLKSYVAH